MPNPWPIDLLGLALHDPTVTATLAVSTIDVDDLLKAHDEVAEERVVRFRGLGLHDDLDVGGRRGSCAERVVRLIGFPVARLL